MNLPGSPGRFVKCTSAGASAGALVGPVQKDLLSAPFAFLGPRYDEVLRNVCSPIGPRAVFHARSIVAALSGGAFANNSPLAAIIAKHVTAEVLACVAREHGQCRLPLVGTTRRDAPPACAL